MKPLNEMLPRSQAIKKTWRNVDWPSVFSAVIYPLLGLTVLAVVIALGLTVADIKLRWFYLPLGLAAGAGTLFLCNQGIGPLHRIWQHGAGELKPVAEFIVALNAILAMQGKLKDWVNHHAQHHRFSDSAGDPHNPAEGKFWAWIGWLIWHDPNDQERPIAPWLKNNHVVRFHDRHHITLSLIVHVVVPLIAYGAALLFGWPIVLVALLHAAAVLGRGIQFHATTLGVNVCGHIKTPKWVTWTLAILTGGEAFHTHHHEFPKSVLHLPYKGLINRLVDYNGTMLLLLHKLRLAGNFHIAPQFK